MIQKITYTTLLFTLVMCAAPLSAQSLLPGFGDARSGTSGFQFTKIAVDARSAGMGQSNVADARDVSSLYWNPALAAQMGRNEVMLGHTEYFADISMEYFGYVHQYRDFSFGASVQYLNSGEMNETTEFNPFGTGRTFRTIHTSVGLTGAHRVTEYFSYGLTFRYMMERIEEVEASTGAIDFGFFYTVGETGLRFSVGMNNFGFDAEPSGETRRQTLDGEQVERDFEDVSPATRFIIGAAYDAYSTENIDLLVTAQILNPSDNNEQLSIGTEMGYMDQFFLRAGYQFGSEEMQWPSAGAGVKLPFMNREFAVDYSFSPFENLGNLHRIGLRILL